jgi:hypothetical protein
MTQYLPFAAFGYWILMDLQVKPGESLDSPLPHFFCFAAAALMSLPAVLSGSIHLVPPFAITSGCAKQLLAALALVVPSPPFTCWDRRAKKGGKCEESEHSSGGIFVRTYAGLNLEQ